jgi:hypothetical protein
MYQIKIPTAMMVRKETIITRPNDGAVQIVRGRMGSFATFHSHRTKATKWRIEMIRRMYSYDSCHPTPGAWLDENSCQWLHIERERTSILPDKVEQNQTRNSKIGSHVVDFPILIKRLGLSRHNECKSSEDYCT